MTRDSQQEENVPIYSRQTIHGFQLIVSLGWEQTKMLSPARIRCLKLAHEFCQERASLPEWLSDLSMRGCSFRKNIFLAVAR